MFGRLGGRRNSMFELAGLKTSTESISPPLLGKIQMGLAVFLVHSASPVRWGGNITPYSLHKYVARTQKDNYFSI